MCAKIITLIILFIIVIGMMMFGLAAGAAATKTAIDQMYEDIEQEKYLREYMKEKGHRKQRSKNPCSKHEVVTSMRWNKESNGM